jgi:hypothetical protein
MRDARVMTLYEGTSQIQKLLIGRGGTGSSVFKHSSDPLHGNTASILQTLVGSFGTDASIGEQDRPSATSCCGTSRTALPGGGRRANELGS